MFCHSVAFVSVLIKKFAINSHLPVTAPCSPPQKRSIFFRAPWGNGIHHSRGTFVFVGKSEEISAVARFFTLKASPAKSHFCTKCSLQKVQAPLRGGGIFAEGI
jgi:hypothetical protein